MFLTPSSIRCGVVKRRPSIPVDFTNPYFRCTGLLFPRILPQEQSSELTLKPSDMASLGAFKPPQRSMNLSAQTQKSNERYPPLVVVNSATAAGSCRMSICHKRLEVVLTSSTMSRSLHSPRDTLIHNVKRCRVSGYSHKAYRVGKMYTARKGKINRN
jgi:hypothetical protein